MTQDSNTPKSGARFVLYLDTHDDTYANYNVTVFLPSRSYATTAKVDTASGGTIVSLDPFQDSPPSWTSRHLSALVKQTANAKRASGTNEWPRRVMRWRSE